MDIKKIQASKGLQYYRQYAEAGQYPVSLTQDQAAAVLKMYDAGYDAMNGEERLLIEQMIHALKDQIHP